MPERSCQHPADHASSWLLGQEDDGLGVSVVVSVGVGDEVSVGVGDADVLVSVGVGVGVEVSVGVGVGVSVGVGDADGDGDAEGDAEADGEADGDAEADLAGAADLAGVIVGAVDGLRNSESDGVRYAFGAGAAGRVEEDAIGVAGLSAVAAGVVCTDPASGWICGAGGCLTAPVSTKTATAEAATSPPEIPADATGRETRCRARRPTRPDPGRPVAASANWMTFPAGTEPRTSAADCRPPDP